MANYEFTKDGENATLDAVDKAIAEAFDQVYQKDTFCSAYQYALEVGMAILLQTSCMTVTPELVDQYLEHKKKRGTLNEEFIEFIRKYQPFLDGTIFQFHAWR